MTTCWMAGCAAGVWPHTGGGTARNDQVTAVTAVSAASTRTIPHAGLMAPPSAQLLGTGPRRALTGRNHRTSGSSHPARGPGHAPAEAQLTALHPLTNPRGGRRCSRLPPLLPGVLDHRYQHRGRWAASATPAPGSPGSMTSPAMDPRHPEQPDLRASRPAPPSTTQPRRSADLVRNAGSE